MDTIVFKPGDPEHTHFDLKHRWDALIDDAWSEEFDLEYFNALVTDTFQYLFPYHAEEKIGKGAAELLLLIHEFALIDMSVSREFAIAQDVAKAFCEQTTQEWLPFEDKIRENSFIVPVKRGDLYFVSMKPFNLMAIFNDMYGKNSK